MACTGSHQLTPQGYRVFIPDPLPPRLSLSPAVLQEVENATHLLGQAEMCQSLLRNPSLIIYGSLQREALASSTIEDTIASPDELILFQAVQHTEREAVREVANYAKALDWGVGELANLPISTRLILSLHASLLEGVRGEGSVGRFKDRQNYIGPHRNAPIEEAIFIPPPPTETYRLIGDLEKYINSPNAEPKVIQCALAHYQFETIHPFGDGNGRVGRLLIILHLIQLGLLSAPLIHPSVYFERTRDQYYQLLQNVREHGTWAEWISYFAKGVSEQSKGTIALAKTLLDLQQTLKQRVSGVRKRASISEVMDAFFHAPVLSSTEIAAMTGLSYNSVSSALEAIEQIGIVREITGRRKGRSYACVPILKAIFPDSTGG